MEKKLIYTNTDEVRNMTSRINLSTGYLQAAYDAFRAIDITPTLEDISSCIHALNQRMALSELEGWVVNYMAHKIDKPSIGGIPVSRESLKNMLEKPDCSSLYDKLNILVSNIVGVGVVQINPKVYYVIENEEIKTRNDLTEYLTELNSEYAATPREIETLSKIMALYAAWRDFYEFSVKNSLRSKEQLAEDMSEFPFFEVVRDRVIIGERTARYIKTNGRP